VKKNGVTEGRRKNEGQISGVSSERRKAGESGDRAVINEGRRPRGRRRRDGRAVSRQQSGVMKNDGGR